MMRLTYVSLGRGLWATFWGLLLLGLPGLVQGATLPAGFVETQIASGLTGPTAMEIAPDGRIFVLEEGGRVRVIKNGALLPTPFVTLNTNTQGERGVLGVAFDPNFATNRFVYLYYTATTPAIHNRVSRFTANAANPDVALPGSEFIVFELPNISNIFHNGGAIHFGADGKLYVATGEDQVPAHSQSLNTTFGKLLRINTDRSIPTDNPFFNQTTGNNRAIWARGFRNPFTFAIQPGTGRIFINDVGPSAGGFEEINEGIAGSNYGWDTCSGSCSVSGLRNPIHQYPTGTAGNCALTGGTFYNPTNPTFGSSFVGKYFFSDFCGRFIRQLDPATRAVTNFATNLVAQPVDLKVGADGSLFYLARGTGTSTGVVVRISRSVNCQITITQHPANRSVTAGTPATFSVRATQPAGCGTLRFQWQRSNNNGTTWTNIAGATSQDFTITPANADNNAMFRAIVSNDSSSVTSNAAGLTVTCTSTPPTATITAPLMGTRYQGGSIINFAGRATDPEDGTLPASALTWRVDFHHNEHTHPIMQNTSGITSGSFTIPTAHHGDGITFFRITLIARDSCGITHQVTRDVTPLQVQITLATNPSGLQVNLEGVSVTTPHTFTSVVNTVRRFGVTSPQTSDGQSCTFQSWSDGGSMTHDIMTPATNTTYTATFNCAAGECDTATSGGPFVNRSFTARNGTFTVEFDATPSASVLDSTIGLSNGASSAHTQQAAIVRFNPAGNIDARNGSGYAAASAIPYFGGVRYHFRLVINVTARTYSIFVTPAGAPEQIVGTNFAFRTEQSGATSLSNLATWVSPNSAGTTVTSCNFTSRVGATQTGANHQRNIFGIEKWISLDQGRRGSAPAREDQAHHRRFQRGAFSFPWEGNFR